MKKILLTSLALLFVLFTGCNAKDNNVTSSEVKKLSVQIEIKRDLGNYKNESRRYCSKDVSKGSSISC